jgi:hypothetical protein
MDFKNSRSPKNAYFINISSSNSDSSKRIEYEKFYTSSSLISSTIKYYNSSSFNNKYLLSLSEELNSLSYSSYKNNKRHYYKRHLQPKNNSIKEQKSRNKKISNSLFSNIKNIESCQLPQYNKTKYYTPKKIVNNNKLNNDKKVFYLNVNYQGKNLKEVFNKIKPTKNMNNDDENFLELSHINEINNNIITLKNKLDYQNKLTSRVHNFKSFFHEFNKQVKNKEKDKRKFNILKLNKYNSSNKIKNNSSYSNLLNDSINFSSDTNEIINNKKDNAININYNNEYENYYNNKDNSFENDQEMKIKGKTTNFNNIIINNKKSINNINNINNINIKNNKRFEQIKRISNSH